MSVFIFSMFSSHNNLKFVLKREDLQCGKAYFMMGVLFHLTMSNFHSLHPDFLLLFCVFILKVEEFSCFCHNIMIAMFSLLPSM